MPSALVPIFFVSGIAGLTFETLWFRLAGLSLGNSVWSASLVLAAFMGGLTLGNGLVARLPLAGQASRSGCTRCSSSRSAIGSFLVVLALPRLSGALGPLFATVADTPWALNTARIVECVRAARAADDGDGRDAAAADRSIVAIEPELRRHRRQAVRLEHARRDARRDRRRSRARALFGIASTGLIAMLLNLAAGAIALRLAAEPRPHLRPHRRRTPFSARTYRYLGSRCCRARSCSRSRSCGSASCCSHTRAPGSRSP